MSLSFLCLISYTIAEANLAYRGIEMTKQKVLISGANSYIAQKLLKEQAVQEAFTFLEINPEMEKTELVSLLGEAKYLLHLYESKTGSPEELQVANVDYTAELIRLMEEHAHRLPFIFTSSEYDDSAYGRSKLLGEQLIREYGQRRRVRNIIYRLPLVMGEDLYLDIANPLHDLIKDMLQGNEAIRLADEDEHIFVDVEDVVVELTRALYGRAFYATVDKSICVISAEHFATWERVLGILRDIIKKGEDYPLPQDKANSLEQKLYRTYKSLEGYYSRI